MLGQPILFAAHVEFPGFLDLSTFLPGFLLVFLSVSLGRGVYPDLLSPVVIFRSGVLSAGVVLSVSGFAPAAIVAPDRAHKHLTSFEPESKM
jgi:hypothetical protein